MKAFVMNVAEDGYNLSFSEFNWTSWRDISPTIGANVFDVVRLYRNGDCAYIDDEGLLKPNQWFWIHKNYPTPLAGSALFCGTDEEGETVDIETTLESLQSSVRFVTRAELHVYSKVNPTDYRPFFFTEEELAKTCKYCGDEINSCSYQDVRAGECEYFNEKSERMEEQNAY